MSDQNPAPTVPAESAEPSQRFEFTFEDKVVGHVDYTPNADTVIVTHTEVYPGNEGKGIGSKLARAALDKFRSEGKQVVPVCSFFAGFLRKTPEYQDMVSAESKTIFNI